MNKKSAEKSLKQLGDYVWKFLLMIVLPVFILVNSYPFLLKYVNEGLVVAAGGVLILFILLAIRAADKKDVRLHRKPCFDWNRFDQQIKRRKI